jgi:HEPN domain-containing protein
MKSYNQIIGYWAESAEYDYVTMKSLFKSGRYASSLFFGHIVLEKVFKGLIVKKTKEHAPLIHDLVRLANIAEIELSESDRKFLFSVNDFNLKARYPEWKLNFYKSCTKDYAKGFIDKIDEKYKELCQKLKQ